MSEAWDGKYIKFFKQLSRLAPNIFHKDIFYKIKEFNNWSSLFPDSKQLNNVKLNEDLINEIFDIEEWVFTRLTKKSGAKTIIKNMYNTFFGKTIIESKKDDNKHSTLIINDKNIEMYNWGVEKLRTFNLNYKITASNYGLDEFID